MYIIPAIMNNRMDPVAPQGKSPHIKKKISSKRSSSLKHPYLYLLD
jgi:hypothetical protein